MARRKKRKKLPTKRSLVRDLANQGYGYDEIVEYLEDEGYDEDDIEELFAETGYTWQDALIDGIRDRQIDLEKEARYYADLLGVNQHQIYDWYYDYEEDD